MFSDRIEYLEIANTLPVPTGWKEYLGILVDNLVESDIKTGIMLMKHQDILKINTLELLQQLVSEEKISAECELGKHIANNHFNIILQRIWRSQIQVCMPLIEIERHAYISTHFGRIESILGVDYWDPDEQEYRVLWKYESSAFIDDANHDEIKCIGTPIQNPYEIDIQTLNKLGYFEKKLEMLGTTSFTPFFSMMREDRDRFQLLSGIYKQLMNAGICKQEQLNDLLVGHEQFVKDRFSYSFKDA